MFCRKFIPYDPNILEHIGIITCICIFVCIVMFLIKFISRVITDGRFKHSYKLDTVIYVTKDGKPYDSTYCFVCSKCGKEKSISVKGPDDWLAHHSSEKSENSPEQTE